MYLNVLLQATEAAPKNGFQQWGNILFILAIFVVFYLFLIRPQSKRQKAVRQFQESLAVGSHVVTSGGVYGKVKEVKDNVLVIEIADNVRIKVNKNMVYDASEPVPANGK
ncbi:MAG: preprotein translocase subunit YajC [Prevotellaceae bacterium]|jgi:preprotein translocase subunit YajC|nr:preprotein translocase subunit YajC [Prevotellaceae bacterium]